MNELEELNKAFENHKCQIWVCCHRYLFPNTAKEILNACIQDNKNSIKFDFIWDDALITRSRALALTAFLEKTDYKVLCFIDDDIYFTGEQFNHMLDNCLNGYDIIGGFYSTKNKPKLASVLEENVYITVPSNTAPVPARYVSTGFVMYHRKVIEAVCKDFKKVYEDEEGKRMNKDIYPYYPVFEKMIVAKEELSEDWAFNYRATQKGFKSWLDPYVNLGHYGMYCYFLQDRFRQETPAVSITFDTTKKE